MIAHPGQWHSKVLVGNTQYPSPLIQHRDCLLLYAAPSRAGCAGALSEPCRATLGIALAPGYPSQAWR